MKTSILITTLCIIILNMITIGIGYYFYNNGTLLKSIWEVLLLMNVASVILNGSNIIKWLLDR